MKLFFRDHLSIIILYSISFLLLPWIIHVLDDLSSHYAYFIFLVTFLFILWLLGRYYRRRKFYHHLQKISKRRMIFIYLNHVQLLSNTIVKTKANTVFILTQQQRLEEQAHEKQLVLSHFAHQMKTPLSVIQLIVQATSNKTTDELQQWHTINKECNKLTFTLNQLLTYERTSHLVADLKIEPIVLKGLVQEVINDLKDFFIISEVFPKLTFAEDQIIYSDRKWLKLYFIKY